MKSFCVLAACILTVAVAASCSAQTLVEKTSTWKYLHPTDGTESADADPDFHTTFFQADFDDSKWKTGKDSAGESGGFGYGEEGFEGVDLGQPENAENRKTAYFRLKFKTTAAQSNLVLKCQFDDGVIVYLDGKEVSRQNLETGATQAYDLFALETVSAEAEVELHSIPIKIELPAGDHILAISLHNRAEGSSDLRLAEVSLEVAAAAAAAK